MTLQKAIDAAAVLDDIMQEEGLIRFNVPTIGTSLRLTSDWTFKLHEERRNMEFAEQFDTDMVTIPSGTIMKIRRIYIRSGRTDYDSITFSIKKKDGKPYYGRFWARLSDVNGLILCIE